MLEFKTSELPLNGREHLNLVALSANVNTLSQANSYATGREGGDRASQSISAAGQRISFDYFTLDGVTNTDPDFNSYIILPPIDAIQEFKVQTGVYPAEFGHETTQINVLTKSGGKTGCSSWLTPNGWSSASRARAFIRFRPRRCSPAI